MEKTYLGDGVYVDFDGYHIVLTTEDGIATTNTVYLDPHVQKALVQFMERLAAREATEASKQIRK